MTEQSWMTDEQFECFKLLINIVRNNNAFAKVEQFNCDGISITIHKRGLSDKVIDEIKDIAYFKFIEFFIIYKDGNYLSLFLRKKKFLPLIQAGIDEMLMMRQEYL